MSIHEKVIILDFGSQYTQLIARRVREERVFCEILPGAVPLAELKRHAPAALILSGGPASVFAPGAPHPDGGIFALGVPVLGICYGLQLLAEMLGGEVQGAADHEYGRAAVEVLDGEDLFHGLAGRELPVWMSHGDRVTALPAGFVTLARSPHAPQAAVGDRRRRIFGLQFHPEVAHTPDGQTLLANFLLRIAGLAGDWRPAAQIDEAVAAIRAQVGRARVVCGLSGGVDSAVTAALVQRAVGPQLACLFVDNGLLREGETQAVEAGFRGHFPSIDFRRIDAAGEFLSALAGVTDPEEKRRRIGHIFIDVFRREAERIDGLRFLAQGTLYPDVIESVSAHGGPTARIKSHHNVGGLPAVLGFELVEPLRLLFKDEVRALGRELGLPESIIRRQPFPGPGLAVRIVGEVTGERLAVLRAADVIVREEIRAAGLEGNIWQAFAVLLCIQSVGVKGDARSYEHVCAVRAVHSRDGMTADWARLDHELLGRVSGRILNEVRGIGRVVYDISSKPPATIEWE